MTTTIYAQAYARPIAVYDGDGNILGLINQDGSTFYLAASGTATGLNGATPAGSTTIDAGTSNTLSSFRCTVNPGDDTIAGTRLLNASSDDIVIIPAVGNAVLITSPTPITAFHGVGISSSTTYTSSAYAIGSAEADLADAMAEDLRIDYDEADNVLQLYVTYETGATSQTAILTVLALTYPV